MLSDRTGSNPLLSVPSLAMNRYNCVFSLVLASFLSFISGCGGGSTTPPPPPAQNPAPSISTLTPSSTAVGSSDTTVTVAGSGFISSSSAEWNGAPLATTFGSSTSLSATIPTSDLGSGAVAKLTVVNPAPGGGTSAAINFSVDNPAPVISKITPSNVVAGSPDTLLDITGSGFLSTTVINWNGAVLSTTFVSTVEVKATLPAADLAGSSTGMITSVNPAPGGGGSAVTTFNVNSPTAAITSISPRAVPPGSAATITITGTGFEANSMALWNGSARPTIVMSSTSLQVALTATDLKNQGTGSLTISNPAPGASSSMPAQLAVTVDPIPVIQSASVATSPLSTGFCTPLQVSVTGQNFQSDSMISANGIALQTIPTTPTALAGFLPIGFQSKAGALTITVANFDGLASDPFLYPASNPPALALCATPSPATVLANSSFSFNVQPTEVNFSGNGTVSLGSLPAGITVANASAPLPPTGAALHLQASSTVPAGTYDLPLHGTAGSATSAGDFKFTVITSGPPPDFELQTGLQRELGISPAGSGSLQFGLRAQAGINSTFDFDVTPSVSGLPTGTTASFSPAVVSVGQTLTVTLSAANGAPVTQNAVVTLTATPVAPVPAASAVFYADVTQPPGSLPGNRTDFVATAGTPYAAVFDSMHNLIFSSNPSWNRIDVISNATHKIIKSIPIRSPRGIDITQDNSHVWVQTASSNIFAIDTVSFQSSPYFLPSKTFTSAGLSEAFSHDKILALSDGTLYVFFDDSGSGGGGQAAIWNPQSNKLTVLASGLITALVDPLRSGDATRVYAANDPGYATGIQLYNVKTQTYSTIGSGTGFFNIDAVNQDGSRLIIYSLAGTNLYDSNLTLLGPIPGAIPVNGLLDGGAIFSPDNTKIFDVASMVTTIDATTLKVLGTAPASNAEPVGTSGAAGTEQPFAIDSAGMLLGIQNFGISFDDSTFYQNYVINQPNSNVGTEYFDAPAGPLAGGTTSGGYAFPSLVPDVWFGQTRGITNITDGQLFFTSPPGTTPGPVNIKFIYPDGIQTFYPQLFSYSTFPEYAVTSGSSPSGGAAAQVVGYGLPADASGGTLTIGSTVATITTVARQNPAYSGEPYPSTVLGYTLPAGTPGRADLKVTTPIGAGSLSKAILYAKSVTDYSSSDTFTAVLLDAKRNQLYLSAGDHIDVFSLASNQFVSSLHPAVKGSQAQFTGLALTPDGSQLLAGDLLDNSLAVISPDSPSSTFAIAIPPPTVPINDCAIGPLFVAATSAGIAFVAEGSLPRPSCPASGAIYVANLQTKATTVAQCESGQGVASSRDGNFVVIGGGPCIYNVQTASYAQVPFPFAYSNMFNAEVSGDANILASYLLFGDLNANIVGMIAQPIALYGPPFPVNPPPHLLDPKLNDSGSMYFLTYPNFFEIIDVPHATLRLRFALTETIQDTGSPLAIDSGGQHVYLITDKGLTVVDFGAALPSIGHLATQNAAPGAVITVRGSGFDSTNKVTVGGVAASATITDQNTMTLTIPSAASGPQDIVLIRGDGEIYTLENAVILP